MKLRLIILGLLLSCIFANAQQEAQYTQYMYNTGNINPAYAGSRGSLSGLIMHRTQWVGLDGAPVTNTAVISSPLGISQKFGLGVSVINDRLGPSDNNVLSVDLSYYVPTSENFKLAFGVKGTADMFKVDFTKVKLFNPNDGLNRENIDNRFSANIGAGLYWYSEKTYLGLSVPYILENNYYDNDIQYVASDRMHLHVMAGHVFNLGSETKFKPSVLSKVVQGAPLQVDLSANFLFFDKLTLGAAYRWSAAVSAMAGFQISDSWLIGYSYDRETTRLGNFNSGSHEVFLRYELFRKYDKVISPRFF
ncbi:type IX secretion system membrane protein PorP/SprF [Flavobacterium amniphilum]|uniref:PorP/SprF family type IX secretion system membrane protein n=1 Tax=Flavobacterium amniphilum TaxID=1834035 RepID=UPI00202A0707|nr:type IX secretion system membrane protein PorP/SprF [Flavobacterium amniphilum]MCL9806107.1 type IX secretion system membrane protein PorP/SprF [Flavobacterium amniphilum]